MIEGALFAARSLHVSAPGGEPILKGVDLQIPSGCITALFGPSGAGKSITLLALAGLVGRGFTCSGQVLFADLDLASLAPAARRKMLGNEIGLVLQEPGRSLNPVLPVGLQVAEGIKYHRQLSQRGAEQEALAALALEGLDPPAEIAALYPHQLSGGMAQRVLLATVLSLKPRVLLMDEPVAALDPMLVNDLLKRLKHEVTETGVALLMVCHDLRLIEKWSNRVCFMAAGRVVEAGETERVFSKPQAPETAHFLGLEN